MKLPTDGSYVCTKTNKRYLTHPIPNSKVDYYSENMHCISMSRQSTMLGVLIYRMYSILNLMVNISTSDKILNIPTYKSNHIIAAITLITRTINLDIYSS